MQESSEESSMVQLNQVNDLLKNLMKIGSASIWADYRRDRLVPLVARRRDFRDRSKYL